MKSQRSFLFYRWGKYTLYITQLFNTFSYCDNSWYNKFFILYFMDRKLLKQFKKNHRGTICPVSPKLGFCTGKFNEIHGNSVVHVGYVAIG